MTDIIALAESAKKAMENSHSPYSGFRVGAALLCEDGTVYTGCNIENASYSVTCCAERTAFFKAVSDGKLNFTDLAVCGGKGGELEGTFCPPCGVCRQVMREFCRDDFKIHLVSAAGIKTLTLAELLPLSFGPENLNG